VSVTVSYYVESLCSCCGGWRSTHLNHPLLHWTILPTPIYALQILPVNTLPPPLTCTRPRCHRRPNTLHHLPVVREVVDEDPPRADPSILSILLEPGRWCTKSVQSRIHIDTEFISSILLTTAHPILPSPSQTAPYSPCPSIPRAPP
jgi:hypothetical protein